MALGCPLRLRSVRLDTHVMPKPKKTNRRSPEQPQRGRLHGTNDDSDSSSRRAGGEKSLPGAAAGGGRDPANKGMAGGENSLGLLTTPSSKVAVRLATPLAAVGVDRKRRDDGEVERGDRHGERPGDGGDGATAATRKSSGSSAGSTSAATSSSGGARENKNASRQRRSTLSTVSDSSSDGESRAKSAVVAVREGTILTSASAGKVHSQGNNCRGGGRSSSRRGDDRQQKEHGDEEEKQSSRDPQEWGASGEGRGEITPREGSDGEHLGA